MDTNIFHVHPVLDLELYVDGLDLDLKDNQMYNHNEQYALDNMEHEGGAPGTPAHQPRESFGDQPWPRVEPSHLVSKGEANG